MPDQLAVEATGLGKSYGTLRVLDGVDLAVARGSVCALLGPNGAGKTTMVRILATLARADAGQARVAGFDVVTGRRQVRRRISLTGQFAAVDNLQTGEENLRMLGRLAGQIALLDGGRVVAKGSPAQLKQRVAGHRLDLVLADAQAFAEADRRLGGRVVQRDPARLTVAVATDGDAAEVRALLDEVDPTRRAGATFAVRSASLDDVFLA